MASNLNDIKCSECGSRHRSVFCSLSSENLSEIDEKKGSGKYVKGDRIFKEGAYSRGLYCVSKGKIKLSRIGASGKEQIVRFAKAGDVMGYNAMLSKSPLSCSAFALEDASICFIPSEHFFNLIKSIPDFSLKMLELTAVNWNEASRLVTGMAQKTSIQRLAEMLLWLKETFGLDEEDCIDVQLSREEIANMVGTATESLIRHLSELNKKKLIVLVGKRIKLLDIHGLSMLAEIFD